MAGHVINPSNKFEDPTTILSRVMSFDISRRIPLRMRVQPCACAVSHDLCVRPGQIFPTYLKSLTQIYLFTMQLIWRCDDV